MSKTIAIDFDGVIHKYSKGWQGGVIYDDPVDGVEDALGKLRAEKYEIVIYTTRDNFSDIWDWLRKYGLDHNINQVTNIKPKAIAYIDDRAIRFTNWPDMRKYFS